MIQQLSGLRAAPPPARDSDETSAEPGFGEAITFLYLRRAQFALRFTVLLGLGVIGFLYVHLSAPKTVEGTVGLTFQGIERHEYPTGRKFSVEDLRGPDVLQRSLADAEIRKLSLGLKDLAARVFVTPLIPAEIQARWRKHDKDGSRKDEYFPNEFKLRRAE